MPDEIERELQFEVPDLAAVQRWIEAQPPYAPLTFRAAGTGTQHDTYLDTDDWAIFRSGYALRMRHKATGGEVTLKALASNDPDIQQRREISQSMDEYNDGSGAGDGVAARVRLLANDRPVNALFEVETERTNFEIRRGDFVLAVLSLDATRILHGGTEVRALSCVEIEEREPGAMAGIEALVRALSEACGLTPVAMSKFGRGIEALGLSPQSYLDVGYTELARDATTGEYAFAILRRFFADLLAHEPGTRLGEDVEELHDMRVATRRLRAAMGLFRDALPPHANTLRDELRWLAQALGEVRDLDVYLDWLTQERSRSDWVDGTAVGLLMEQVRKHRDESRERLLDVMGTGRYAALIDGMGRMLRQGDDGVGESAQPVAGFGARMLRKRWRRVRRDGKRLTPDSPDEAFHAERVATKRLRYALEALEPVFPRRAKSFIRATKDVQDLLGEHQDAVVAIERLRGIIALAETSNLPAAAIFHTGELTERQRFRMQEIRVEWPKAFRDLRKSHKSFAKRMDGSSSTDHSSDKDLQKHAEAIDTLARPPV